MSVNDDQGIEAMLKSNGQWITLHTWSSEDALYDAAGWINAFGDRVGSGSAKLPGNCWVDLSQFAAVRELAP